jgi:hypothetical protein
MSSGRAKNQNDDKAGFTERAIMALVMEAAEMKETATRFGVLVAALAVAHGISTDV